jgi:hypothetical protein
MGLMGAGSTPMGERVDCEMAARGHPGPVGTGVVQEAIRRRTFLF